MKKYFSITILLIGFGLNVLAQKTGVNTKNPQGALHVDAGKNNAVTGTPTGTQSDDDFIVDANGNIGIGILAPSTKLHVLTKGTAANPVSGIRIQDGSQGRNYVLMSDGGGNAKWVNHPIMTPNVVGLVQATVLFSNFGGTGTGSSSAYRDSGFSITLTEGDWIVSAGLTFTDIGRLRPTTPAPSADFAFWQKAYLSSSTSVVDQVGFSHLGTVGNLTCYGAPMIDRSNRGLFEIGFVTGSSVINVPAGATTTIHLLIENKPTGYYKYDSANWENYFYAFPIVR